MSCTKSMLFELSKFYVNHFMQELPEMQMFQVIMIMLKDYEERMSSVYCGIFVT